MKTTFIILPGTVPNQISLETDLLVYAAWSAVESSPGEPVVGLTTTALAALSRSDGPLDATTNEPGKVVRAVNSGVEFLDEARLTDATSTQNASAYASKLANDGAIAIGTFGAPTSRRIALIPSTGVNKRIYLDLSCSLGFSAPQTDFTEDMGLLVISGSNGGGYIPLAAKACKASDIKFGLDDASGQTCISSRQDGLDRPFFTGYVNYEIVWYGSTARILRDASNELAHSLLLNVEEV